MANKKDEEEYHLTWPAAVLLSVFLIYTYFIFALVLTSSQPATTHEGWKKDFVCTEYEHVDWQCSFDNDKKEELENKFCNYTTILNEEYIRYINKFCNKETTCIESQEIWVRK